MLSQAFFQAIESGDLERLQSLLADSPFLVGSVVPADEGSDGTAGGTGLHVAIQTGNAQVVRLLIRSGVDLEALNAYGRTALHDSIEFGAHEIEKFLLEAGAEIDICAAAIRGMIQRVRQLLDEDPELVNERSTNLSPLSWASFGNQVDVARELIARGARMDDGELLCAASVGHVEVGRLLLEHGADLNEIDHNAGCTALHAAAGMRYTHDSSAFVSMLLAAGADPSIPTRDGRTALQIAEEGAERGFKKWDECGEKNFSGVAALLRNVGSSNT
jgi:ankyrin repeat protein